MNEQISAADWEIVDTAGQLQGLKGSLGDAYWRSDEAFELRETLRRLIGQYAAWRPDKPPMQRRARIAARYQSEYAELLWPGGERDPRR